MASPNDSSAVTRASLHSLPLELIHHIIQLAVPLLDPRTFFQRYLILRRLALVNAAWSRLAQTELHRHISLSRAGYNTLANALEQCNIRDEGAERSAAAPTKKWKLALVQSASTIWLKAKEDPWEVEELRRIVEHLPNVSEVRVGHIMAHPYASDYLGSSAFASRLRILHLSTTLLTPTSFSHAADVFPNLTELVLESPCSFTKALDFLQFTSFPSLRTLALLEWTRLDVQHGARLDAVLRPLAPKLLRFAFECSETFVQIRPDGSHAFQIDFTPFTSLRHLSATLAPGGISLSDLQRLPTQLSTLRLLDSILHSATRIGSFLNEPWPASLAAVKKLILPGCDQHYIEEECGAGLERCTAKGIVVEFRDTTDFD